MIIAIQCELQGLKEIQEREKYLCAGCWPQIAEMHMKGAISFKPRLLYLPIHRKVLNSLTRDTWFSLFTTIFWCSGDVPLVGNFYITWVLPPSSEQFSQGHWDAVSWAWNPISSHQIKHNSQFLGCDCFLKSTVLTSCLEDFDPEWWLREREKDELYFCSFSKGN